MVRPDWSDHFKLLFVLNETGYLFRLLKRMLFLLLLYSICRILFLAFNFNQLASPPVMAFVHGIRFDLSAIAFINSVYLLLYFQPFRFRYNRYYQWFLSFLFLTTNIIALFWNLVDLEYFKFTSKRSTWDVFGMFIQGNDIANLSGRFLIDFWYLPLIFIFISLSLIIYYRRTRVTLLVAPTLNLLHRSLVFFLFMGLALLAARGGFQLKPLHLLHAGNMVPAQYVPLVLNTPFTLLKTIGDAEEIPPIAKARYDSTLFSPVQNVEPIDSSSNNLVILVLESFGSEYLEKGFTPFLDSLRGVSIQYPNTFATGKKSIEGIPAILAGIPSWSEIPFGGSAYISNRINSIASILKTKGYSSAFYHGARNGTMNLDAFCMMAGFDQYHGLDQYRSNTTDYDGHWGIFDLPYLQYVCDEITGMRAPFFATAFTLSSHHPYTVPDSLYKTLPSGPLPIHKSVAYTDLALKEFFEKAKTQAWFSKTTFIITADHTGPSRDPFYSGRIGMFSVPLLIYRPDIPPNVIDQLTSHLDIMGLALSYSGISATVYSLGNEPGSDSNVAIQYLNGIFQIFDNEYLLLHDGQEPKGLYKYRTDSLLNGNLMESEKTKTRTMTQMLGSRLSVYYDGLTNNRMTPDARNAIHH